MALTPAGLATPRLTLRPATPEDVEALWALWSDPEVRRYLFDNEPVARERAAKILGESLALADRGLGLWLVSGRGDEAIVGCVGLLPVTAAAPYDPTLAGGVEILAALAPSVWRRGYAREALGVLIGYAFGSLGLPQLIAVCDEPNESSDRMLRALGFAPTGGHQGPRYRARSYVLTPQAFATIAGERGEGSGDPFP